jgi:hypothetical protein
MSDAQNLCLTEGQWTALLRDGIVKIPGVYAGDPIRRMQAAINTFYDANPNGNVEDTNKAASEPRPDGIILFSHMPLYDPIFQEIVEHPIAISTLERMLGPDFYLSDFSMRKVRPGAPRMPFHKDVHGGFSMLVLTDDIAEEEGATTYVPGSHINSPAPMYCMKDTRARHPDEIQATGKAGDLYFFFLDGWHARAANMSDRYTGIMLPDFRNCNSRPQPFLRKHMKGARLRAPIVHMLRDFEPRPAVTMSPIERIALRGNTCEQFFSEFLYYWAAYGFKKRRRDILPGQTTAAFLTERAPIRRYFGRLSLQVTARALALYLVRSIPGGRGMIARVKASRSRSS